MTNIARNDSVKLNKAGSIKDRPATILDVEAIVENEINSNIGVVTQQYVNQEDANTLVSAQNYTNTAVAPFVNNPSRITILENNVYKITYYEIITGASGSITVPTGATINGNEFGVAGNCVLSEIDGNNKPTYVTPQTIGGVPVSASLNVGTGGWIKTGVTTSTNVALIYSVNITGIDYSNLNNFYVLETIQVGKEDIYNKSTDGTFSANSDILYPSQKAAKTYADTKEPAFAAGTISQYRRGDKTWQTLDKTVIGLSNVENTALSTWNGSGNIITTGTLTTGATGAGFTINFSVSTLAGTLPDANISSATTWNAKQTALVSGTNIKTVGGTSLLGSGDLGSITTSYTDAKIKGGIAATSGLIPYGTGTADTVTSSANLKYDGTKLQVTSTTEILRLAYDGSSYATFIQQTGGGLLIDVVSSNPFAFFQDALYSAISLTAPALQLNGTFGTSLSWNVGALTTTGSIDAIKILGNGSFTQAESLFKLVRNDNDGGTGVRQMQTQQAYISNGTPPSAGWGVRNTYQLGGNSGASLVSDVASFDLIWETTQTNNTTARNSAFIFRTMKAGTSAESWRIGGTNRSITNKGGVGQAFIDVIGITEQLRVGYDASNYQSITVDSAGSVTYDLTGTTPTFTFNKSLKLGTAGNGFFVKEGTNATMGTGTLVGGTVTISTTKVTANSRIYVTDIGGGVFANIGALTVPTSGVTAGTSFTVTSTNALDTSSFNWIIFEPT